MRLSRYFIPTYKEVPADAEVVSHQLMLRAGLIRKLTSGIYTYLPAGLRAIRKVEQIIREEMNRAGAIEVLMPAVQPAELWRESGRWDYYGRELLRFKDRHNREACLGPTHEEVITDLVRREIHSYKQMPVNFYQIQTKFRDEIRPRFGVMRGREFIMKDAYSFDVDEDGAERSYKAMYEAYERIFQRCGLRFRAVEADTGTIGGSYSHEYMVLAETGEDEIVSCSACDYAANLEKAEIGDREAPASTDNAAEIFPLEEVETPDVKSVEEVTAFLSIPPETLVKTLIYRTDKEIVAALVRGDHELNEVKLKNALGAQTVELADSRLVEETTGAPMGFAGPMGLKVRILADRAVRGMRNFVTGGNRKDLHLKNVNLGRDFDVERFEDLRVVAPGDVCPRCGGPIRFGRGIEVGHIFKLGTKYSEALRALFLDRNGKEKPIVMGCYGIGVGRTVAAAIEQNHDEKGIIFPIPIAPFEATILPLQMNDARVMEAAETLYGGLMERGVDVLIDDRDERAGVKFNDADLTGIPLRVTVGRKGIEKGIVEIKLRRDTQSVEVPLQGAVDAVLERIKALYDSPA
ncbi:MAG: proline--tRNA ligase [Deltaproteobacteria bacterium]|nr:proline--tRNA ligase [Deltaproteobacteria bacterium]MBW1924561.1 proline--tRNA ligase [Deltaproteobacteria bacterium]MBW1947991.1 proline--tRNA ligase [Deltaproteobacteria bacterium]MBW2007516.1 proline--tRNA ligase [Deltaproteobacteria bacterium]MBW2101653.1 proline--tRNA ligase [Deltaproteobacteria bacterium]